MELGGLIAGDVPEAMASDFWAFYTRHMAIGERMAFGGKVLKYRNHLRDESRKAARTEED